MSDLAPLVAAITALPPGRRLVALAGPPASGKSTTAEHLARAVSAAGRRAEVVPMDGFHLDNLELDKIGLRDRKGAPETFDIKSFTDLLEVISDGGACPYPTFDRAADATVPGGGHLHAATEIVVVEGNYLLLDAPGWRDLHGLWDLSIALTPPADVLRDRLVARWRDHGWTEARAHAWIEGNDLPNIRRVLTGSVPADITLP